MVRLAKLVLASASIRRKELLKLLNVDFEVIVSNFQEDKVIFNGSCSEYVITLAEGKALNVAENLKNEQNIIIGCDTIVSINNEILGKPSDKEEAMSMLKKLSGKEHFVYSGITVVNSEKMKIISDFQRTKVIFSELDDDMIKWYVDTGEPMDKAGAYGIQGYAGAFVKGIQGCYYNVVGLPLNKLSLMLRDMGVNLYKGVK